MPSINQIAEFQFVPGKEVSIAYKVGNSSVKISKDENLT